MPLSRQTVALLKQIQAISDESVFTFQNAHTLNKGKISVYSNVSL